MIKYIDEFDNEISQQEAFAKTNYKELYFDKITEHLKLAYEFENGKIVYIKYYKTENEVENEILMNLINKCSRISIILQQKYKNYIIEYENEYEYEVLHFKTRYLINSKNEYICWEELDLISGLPNYQETKKYLFENSNIIELLEASYNQDGSLDHIIYKPLGDDNWGQDWESYSQENFQELQKKFEQNLDYYLNSKLEPEIE